MAHDGSFDLKSLTADVVCAYVANNSISAGDIPTLIGDVYQSLQNLTTSQFKAIEIVEEKKAPAVPVKKSVADHEITCLECGSKYKSLKRHIMSSHELTPEQYREKWNLPADYPMVAPEYAATRSALAKTIGLGRKPGTKLS